MIIALLRPEFRRVLKKTVHDFFVYAVRYKQRFSSPKSDGDLDFEIGALRGPFFSVASATSSSSPLAHCQLSAHSPSSGYPPSCRPYTPSGYTLRPWPRCSVCTSVP